MEGVAETQNSIIFDKPMFKKFVGDLTERVTELAVIATRKELLKDIDCSSSEAAKLLGVSKSTVIRYCATGRIPYRKEGEKYIINKYDIEKFKSDKKMRLGGR